MICIHISYHICICVYMYLHHIGIWQQQCTNISHANIYTPNASNIDAQNGTSVSCMSFRYPPFFPVKHFFRFASKMIPETENEGLNHFLYCSEIIQCICIYAIYIYIYRHYTHTHCTIYSNIYIYTYYVYTMHMIVYSAANICQQYLLQWSHCASFFFVIPYISTIFVILLSFNHLTDSKISIPSQWIFWMKSGAHFVMIFVVTNITASSIYHMYTYISIIYTYV